ncbi:hypothetical protein [Micromonospora halophytica]|uniref:Uncharacterized protein n=1 Tax=Micromonospora halophytica TaxID=47864 RepID=A0A1C5IPJ9_9ACTN|nr:hypothetical protein [Micromonospora halophytica]SCG59911.1 hypothetical protein GA0070560_11469 [Micromonospora halophytica]
MNAVATSLRSPGDWGRLVRRDVLMRALGSAPCFAVVPGGNMSSLDRVVPQATQLPLLNRMVEMVVLGEDGPTWLQHKIGFKNLRNVDHYLAAPRRTRLIEEDAIRPTSLGRRYVSSRLEPRVILEGVRGRARFEEVMRMTGGDVPTPDVVASVLRRRSFRYSKGTVTRRARDFCRLFGRITDEAASPKERQLMVHSAWVEPQDLLAVDGVAAIWPALSLTPVKGIRRSRNTSRDEATDAQLRLPLEEDA